MARILRTDLPDGRFHVTACGAGGTHIFVVDLDRVLFLRALDITMRRYGWELLAYCLMGTHYHLVLDVKAGTLPPAMRWLNGVYSRGFNKRYERRGHLLGARYDTWLIRDEQHFRATIEYVLDNPVRAGLCAEAKDWPWSYAAEDAA